MIDTIVLTLTKGNYQETLISLYHLPDGKHIFTPKGVISKQNQQNRICVRASINHGLGYPLKLILMAYRNRYSK